MKGGIATCRACGADGLAPILTLGRTPLANALLTAEQLDAPEPTYPLDLVRCPGCTLVQITETVPPEVLFRRYPYFSSVSETFLGHASALAERLVAERRLGPGSLVVELASNDGYLLQYYRRHGVPVLGIEPAENVAEVARRDRGIPTLSEFFGTALALRLRDEGRRADVLHAHNVLAHVADLGGFVAGIGLLLADDGVAILEVPYVRDMVDRCEFDTIYHEHLCYFSLTALTRLFARHRLVVQQVERLVVHGGSLRLSVARGGVPGESVEALLLEEKGWGVEGRAVYQGFGRRVETLIASIKALLVGLAGRGASIAGYGAAAKGATLLNVLGIGRDVVRFVVDRSPHKQGHYLPGVRVPILPPEALLERMPSHVLLLAWNLADEVLAQQADYRRRGGRFIIPIPELVVV
jgi:SAM-dependent methyltransferase